MGNIKHGQCRRGKVTPEHRAFRDAKQRCDNPNHARYADWGGRGIRFLFVSFEQFFAELGPRPPGMTLDRINNDGNYEPANVKWSTRSEQSRNQRLGTNAQNGQNRYNRGVQRNNTSGFKGASFHRRLGKWAASISVNGQRKHLGLFATAEAAARAYDRAAIELHCEFACTNAMLGLLPPEIAETFTLSAQADWEYRGGGLCNRGRVACR